MRKVLAIALAAICSPLAQAAGIMEIYRVAQQEDPVIKAAREDRNAFVEARNQSYAALYLPVVNLSATTEGNSLDSTFNGNRTKQRFNDHSYSLTLTQPVYWYNRKVALAQADDRIAQAEASYGASQQDLMVRVVQRYVEILAAQDTLNFAIAEKTAIERQLEQTRQRFDVGLIAITAVHEAQAAYDLAVAQELAASNALENAKDALMEITGNIVPNLTRLNADIPMPTPEPAVVSEWVDTSIKQNLTLEAARLAAVVAGKQVRIADAGHRPVVDLVVSRQYSDSAGGNFGGTRSENDSIGLQMNLPLYQGGSVVSQTKEARHRQSQAEFQAEQQRRAIVRQTRESYTGLISSLAQVKALKQALVSTQSALDATEAGFDVGTRTIVDVLDAQRDLYSARRDYSRERYNYLLNHLRLKQAAGTLAETDLVWMDSLFQGVE